VPDSGIITPRGRSYDEFAEDFERDASVGACNALYDRPTVLAMLGDVRGRHVLDVGCDPVWVPRSRSATANDCASPTLGASLDGRRHRDLARCDRARQHILRSALLGASWPDCCLVARSEHSRRSGGRLACRVALRG
jgi:hypothetical protein